MRYEGREDSYCKHRHTNRLPASPFYSQVPDSNHNMETTFRFSAFSDISVQALLYKKQYYSQHCLGIRGSLWRLNWKGREIVLTYWDSHHKAWRVQKITIRNICYNNQLQLENYSRYIQNKETRLSVGKLCVGKLSLFWYESSWTGSVSDLVADFRIGRVKLCVLTEQTVY
jgi:hypothetical protein